MRFMFQNKSGQTYPAYGCGRLKSILSTDEATGNPVFELVKPDGADGIYVINGPNNIVDDALGVAVSLESAMLVLVDDGDVTETPEFGGTCGPKSGRWAATTAGLGMIATGVIANRLMPVIASPQVGGDPKIISFQIISSVAGSRSALVQIEQRMFRGTVYGSILEDTVVRAYDTRGCYLNEPNVDLTGRFGEAKLFYTDDAAIALHFPDDYPPEKYWMVTAICCPTIVCEDGE